MPKRILFDVTTLLKWGRPPAGIIRVTLELAKYLCQNNEHTPYVFVKFSDDKSSITLVETEVVLDAIYKIEHASYSIERTKLIFSIKGLILKLTPARYHYILRLVSSTYRSEGVFATIRKSLKVGGINLRKGIDQLKKLAHKHSISKPIAEVDVRAEVIDHLNSQVPNYKILGVDIGKEDIFISTGLDWDNSAYKLLFFLKKHLGISFVGASYDTIPFLHPEYYIGINDLFFRHLYYSNYLSNRIFCISDFSKAKFKEVVSKHFSPYVSGVKAICLGDHIPAPIDDHQINQSLIQTNPYILYVSTVEVRKNHITLLKAWLKAKEKGIDMPNLIFVGMLGWQFEEVIKLYKSDKWLQRKVTFLGKINDSELNYLYRNCLFCVFPSFIEGWGLSAAEAMTYGKACVISTAEALNEATRGLMPRVDPYDVDAWLDKLSELANDKDKLAKLELKIKENFKPKSWESFSKEFFEFAVDNNEPAALKNSAALPESLEIKRPGDLLAEEISIFLDNIKYLLFFGSADERNAIGFWNQFGLTLGKFAPDQKILVVGGVSDILMEYAPESPHYNFVNREVIIRVGNVNQEILSTLIANSSGIILPVTIAGDSNLNTAEAISSCKPVVATSAACRGFDFVNKLSNFYICDEPEDFSKTARDIVAEKIKCANISSEEKELRESLHSSIVLGPLEDLLNEINTK